jgi:hypothetical protein
MTGSRHLVVVVEVLGSGREVYLESFGVHVSLPVVLVSPID